MATSTANTKFKVENGLDVIGTANVSGGLRVEGDLSVGGNLAFTLTTSGDIKPVDNTYNLGAASQRWTLNAMGGDFAANVAMTGTLTVNNTVATGIIPSQNNGALGSTTRRWDFYANTATIVTIAATANAALANVTVSNTFTIGLITANQTTFVLGNTQFSVNTGSKLAIAASGNSTYSNLSLTNDVTAIAGNVAFDTDLLTLDATNNRIGLKTGITSLSTAAVATITGNIEFSVANTGIRLNTATSTVNGSIMMVANSTNSRVTFATYDNSNASIQNGGYNFNSTNSTATQTLLSLNGYQLQYKSGNVAHSGNFGIYNVSGVRVGP